MIKNEIVSYITDILATAKQFDKGTDQYEIMRYGVETLYINTWKTVLLLIVAYALGIAVEVIIFMVSYSFMRLYSFGIHLKTAWGCTTLGFVVSVKSGTPTRSIDFMVQY